MTFVITFDQTISRIFCKSLYNNQNKSLTGTKSPTKNILQNTLQNTMQ